MASGEEEGLFDFLPEQAAPERVGGGLPRLRFAERMQTRWRPVSLDGLLPDDHRVRLVWSFVEGLDLTALLATIKAVDGRPGHPPADPRILLALWLYATVEGIGSAREVARLCDEHIAFEWLCGGATDTKSTAIAGVSVDNIGSDMGKMLPMNDALAGQYGTRPRQHLADGGFAKLDDIEALAQNGVETFVPVPKPRNADRDRHAPQPSDPPGVADWRNRMGGDDAKTIYKERAATAECANAQARNRGLTQFLVRSMDKVKTIALWHALTHNMVCTWRLMPA